MEKHYILEGLKGKDTHAALILQLNAERLETGIRFPKRKQSCVEMTRGAQNLKKYKYLHFGLASESFGGKKHLSFHFGKHSYALNFFQLCHFHSHHILSEDGDEPQDDCIIFE